jgi:NADH:ubiquinone oxidoreductase subunit F (NADH-binding)
MKPARWAEPGDVRSLAGEKTRLLLEEFRSRETRAEYQARGGYLAGLDGEDLIKAVEAAHLLGRGGAAFPAAIKLRSVRERGGPRYLVVNGEEGEPLSVKDRWLLRIRPHLVLDGAFRAARAISAAKIFVYLADPLADLSVRAALAELTEPGCPVEVVQVAPAYVAGEETAVVRAINGGPALPVDKPPRPFEAGVDGQPTLVANVETLANIPFLDDPELRSPDTFLLTLSGACRKPGLYEVAFESRLSDVLSRTGGVDGPVQGALMGGFFAGLIGARVLDLPLSYHGLREQGSGLGCGAIWLMGRDECPVRVAADVMYYFLNNNARQCGPCIRGTAAMSAALDRLAAGAATADDLTRLTGWTTSLRGRGACGYLDGAANLPATLLREFGDHVDLHRAGPCPRSGDADPAHRLDRLKVPVG